MKPIVIIGVGTEAKLAAEYLTLHNHVVYGFLAIDKMPPESEFYDVPVLGTLSNKDLITIFKNPDQEYVIALSNPELRKATLGQMFKLTGRLPFNVIHPTAVVSNYAKMATGNLIGAKTTINPGASIGVLNVIGSAVVVESEVVMGDYCTIGSGTIISQGTRIENNVFIGSGCLITPGVTIGTEAVISSGVIIQQDFPAGAKAIAKLNYNFVEQIESQ